MVEFDTRTPRNIDKEFDDIVTQAPRFFGHAQQFLASLFLGVCLFHSGATVFKAAESGINNGTIALGIIAVISGALAKGSRNMAISNLGGYSEASVKTSMLIGGPATAIAIATMALNIK